MVYCRKIASWTIYRMNDLPSKQPYQTSSHPDIYGLFKRYEIPSWFHTRDQRSGFTQISVWHIMISWCCGLGFSNPIAPPVHSRPEWPILAVPWFGHTIKLCLRWTLGLAEEPNPHYTIQPSRICTICKWATMMIISSQMTEDKTIIFTFPCNYSVYVKFPSHGVCWIDSPYIVEVCY